jgi:branched-chain amino acid transport system substrate-binding protein
MKIQYQPSIIRKKLFAFVIVMLVAGNILAGCSASASAPAASPTAPQEASQEKTSIKLGFIADVSGVGFLYSQSQLAALKLALEDINAQGGILGLPVEYIMRDSELNPELGATIAEQMILEDNVDFLLGPTSSGVGLAVSEVAKKYKTILVIHTCSTAQLTTDKGHPYLVQVTTNTTMEGRAAAHYAAQLPYTKWGAVNPDYSHGHDQFGVFEARLKELKPSVEFVSVQWPQLSEKDLTPYIKALQDAGVEAIFLSLWGGQLTNFAQQANGMNLEAPYIGLFDVQQMITLGDDLPDGNFGFDRIPFYAIDTPQAAEFTARYKQLTGKEPDTVAFPMYDGVMLLKAAAEKAGTTDGEAVAQALDDLKFQSLRGELTVRACDHQVNVTEYVGVVTRDPQYSFPILGDIMRVPAEDVWNTCEEIQQMRQAEAASAE